MRKLQLVRRGLPWVLAAVMAVALPGVNSAWALANGQTAKLLSSQLPAGVTLAKASIDQTATAVNSAVTQRPDLATSLVQVAVLAKTPKQGQGMLACGDLKKIVNGGVTAAPNKASEIVQMALSLHPECADDLNALVTGNNSNSPDGYSDPSQEYGQFGVGFGPGFPGSPGFIGSSPSGATSLPPVVPVVTSVVNT